jgi:fatty-acyl-CoA synthase
MANFPDFVPLKFAIARAGAVCVPLNLLYRRDELAYVLAQSQATALVTMDGFAGLDHLAALDEITADERTALPGLRDMIVAPVAGTGRVDVPTLADVEALGAAHLRAAAGRASTARSTRPPGRSSPPAPKGSWWRAVRRTCWLLGQAGRDGRCAA